MLNVGPLELLTICVLALIVLGPDRLPGALRSVGRAVGELRRISGGFQDELRRAMDEAIDDSDVDVPEVPERPREVPPVIPPEEAAGLDLPSERPDDADADDADAGDTAGVETVEMPAGNHSNGSEDSSSDSTADESASVTEEPPLLPGPAPAPAPAAEPKPEPETPA